MNIGPDRHGGPISPTGENSHMVTGATGLARQGSTDHCRNRPRDHPGMELTRDPQNSRRPWLGAPTKLRRPRLGAPRKPASETRCGLKTLGRRHPQNVQASTHKTQLLDTHKTLQARGPKGGRDSSFKSAAEASRQDRNRPSGGRTHHVITPLGPIVLWVFCGYTALMDQFRPYKNTAMPAKNVKRNQRPPDPQSGALPSCATARDNSRESTAARTTPVMHPHPSARDVVDGPAVRHG